MWRASVFHGTDSNAVLIEQHAMELLIEADEIDALIERLETLKSEVRPKYDRGKFVLIWPEALRQLQQVVDGDLEPDDEHDLLVDLAEAGGLQAVEREDEEEIDVADDEDLPVDPQATGG